MTGYLWESTTKLLYEPFFNNWPEGGMMVMDRRNFLKTCRNAFGAAAIPSVAGAGLLSTGILASNGCAGRQYGHLLAQDDVDMVGSHQAGAAVWNPLVDESVAKLLGRCETGALHAGGYGGATLASAQLPPLAPGELPPPMNHPEFAAGGAPIAGPAKVCFIALENKSAEELVDFKEQLYERIDSQVNQSDSFRMVSRRMVDAALLETRLRPDSIFLPDNRAVFTAALGRQGSPVDFLLYGKITSGTTECNKSTQRDYQLTLEMVNVHTGDYVKESATIRKGYHKNRTGKWWNYGPFQQADG